jgi:hypothetical protein
MGDVTLRVVGVSDEVRWLLDGRECVVEAKDLVVSATAFHCECWIVLVECWSRGLSRGRGGNILQ